MSTPNPKRHEKLLKDLAELKLHRIAEIYQEVLDEAARKQSSMLDVLEALGVFEDGPGRYLGGEPSRSNGVDPNVQTSPLGSQFTSQTNQSSFARRVRRLWN